MKIGILGGTGTMGLAIASRLASRHEVLIGSRVAEKAEAASSGIRGAIGTDYQGAARKCDSAIVAIPFSAMHLMDPLGDALSGKLVISTINPLKVERGLALYGLQRGSAAETLAARLPRSRVATAFNNIPAGFLRKGRLPPIDVLIAADSKSTFSDASLIVASIPALRPLYAGPLSEAQTVERITPLVLNLASKNGTGRLAPRFISREENG